MNGAQRDSGNLCQFQFKGILIKEQNVTAVIAQLKHSSGILDHVGCSVS